jgi:hypothetical protein
MDSVRPTHKNPHASQCEGKVAFKRIGHARAAAKRRTGRVVYRCKHCFHWHVGTPERKEKKFAKRDKLIRLYDEPEWQG